MPPPGRKKLQETFIVSKDGRSKPQTAPTAVSQKKFTAKVTKKDKESPAAFEARTGLKASSLTNLNTTAILQSLKEDPVKTVDSEGKLSLNTENAKDHYKKRISEDSENENKDEDDFDKKFLNDYHFVVAKCVVRRKIGFNIDKNSNVSGFRKKMMRVLEQADIMKLRSALDGDSVSVPKHFKLPEEDAKAPVKSQSDFLDPCQTEQVSLLDSNGNSPDISLDEDDVKPPEEQPDNMPVIACMMDSPEKVQEKEVGLNLEPTTSVKRKKQQLLEDKFYSLRWSKGNKGKTVQKISFKIPKQKVCIPKWTRNGKLWQWALTVDENGQFSV